MVHLGKLSWFLVEKSPYKTKIFFYQLRKELFGDNNGLGQCQRGVGEEGRTQHVWIPLTMAIS